MGLKDIVLSARTCGFVMNYPLYDGGVSEKARRLIAEGRVAAALAEYQRLAATGSAIAKCVLAYLHLRDFPGAPHDVEASKVLATAALSREPGYANFILSYAAHFENDAKRAVHLMAASDLPGDFRTSQNLRRWPPRITRDHEKVEIQRRADGADRA
jgi:hypothetical protein